MGGASGFIKEANVEPAFYCCPARTSRVGCRTSRWLRPPLQTISNSDSQIPLIDHCLGVQSNNTVWLWMSQDFPTFQSPIPDDHVTCTKEKQWPSPLPGATAGCSLRRSFPICGWRSTRWRCWTGSTFRWMWCSSAPPFPPSAAGRQRAGSASARCCRRRTWTTILEERVWTGGDEGEEERQRSI